MWLRCFQTPKLTYSSLLIAPAEGYSIIVKQVRHWDASLPDGQQQHEMIVRKGSIFKHSERNWAVIEKETFIILKACNDLECLLLRPHRFRLYCDDASIEYGWRPSLSSSNTFEINCSGGRCDSVVRTTLLNIYQTSKMSGHILFPVGTPEISFALVPYAPTVIMLLQVSLERSKLPQISKEEVGVVTINNSIWVLTSAKELLARNFVAAHCDSHTHCGHDPMVLVLKARFFIIKQEAKVAKFVSLCLLCKQIKDPRLIQRPYGPLLTPSHRNELVYWDFLALDEGFGESSYLVVKDGLSHFCGSFPCATPTSYIATEALMVKHLAARFELELDFTPVYSPWLNGTVERLNKGMLCTALPALLVFDANMLSSTTDRSAHVVDLTNMSDHVDQILSSLLGLHRAIMDVREHRRPRDVAVHKGSLANCDAGDFVIWSRIDQRLPNHKVGRAVQNRRCVPARI
ncbi:hypothetical protein PHPALM_28113 [Phytophthora palmivora]|uniref:Uncharacterized protein n=1 Tax=Phytophthora palmivora TaxID=4796 RepID=A0A2P4XAX0_9STRA|nr:hypothetical protein PHPALM_28113 [Phytophthora palmivora]